MARVLVLVWGTLLLEGDTPGTYEELAMKEKIIRKIIISIKKNILTLRGAPDNPA